MVQVPLARIIELINNVARREMAVIKEPRLCVKILVGRGCGVQGCGAEQTWELTPPCNPLIHRRPT